MRMLRRVFRRFLIFIGVILFGMCVVVCVIGLIRRSCRHQSNPTDGPELGTKFLQVSRPEVVVIRPGTKPPSAKDCFTYFRPHDTFVLAPLDQNNLDPSSGIPRLLHRTWKDADIPTEWQRGFNSCQQANLDFQVCLWTDEELLQFISSEYPAFLPTYLQFPYPIQRVDAARYFLIYHYGGVYMDLDITCKVPFKEILANRSITVGVMLAEAEPSGVVGDFLAAKPRHPFMRHVTSGLSAPSNWFLIPYMEIMLSTGPWFLSQRFWSSTDRDSIEVLSTFMYRDRYFGHLRGSSWQCYDGVAIWWIFRMRYRILFSIVIFSVIFTCRRLIYNIASFIIRIYRERKNHKLYSR